MKNKKAFYIALAVALSGAILIKLALDSERKRLLGQYEQVTVVVAAKDVLRYEIITQDMLALKRVPKPFVQPLAVIAGEEGKIIGFNMADATIKKGEQLTRTKLALIGEGGVSPIIPSKMRACTVAVNEVSGVAGLIRNRDTVDIIGIFRTLDKQTRLAKNVEAKTLLQNIQVLAVGKNYVFDRPSHAGQDKTSKNSLFSGVQNQTSFSNVTLLLTPKQCMDLAVAQQIGDLSLSLRSYHDRLSTELNEALEQETSTSQSVTGITQPLQIGNKAKWLEVRGGQSSYVP